MSNISRRHFFRNSAYGALPLFMLSGSVHAFAGIGSEDIVVETAFGKIRGYRERGVNIFKGVPYGGKVSGERRWRRPAPLEPWAGIRDAKQLGNPAIQPPNQTYGVNEPDPDEECLVLNIWTPANDSKKRPVMFYNHGGGFTTGSGGSAGQDGANLARYYDVVVVETNHRLSLMGYLYLDEIAGDEYLGSGNNGMLDIVDGLKWVNQNIGQFGGDSSNVMIYGESGGGAKTSCLYAMPAAAPYFNKASIESGPGVNMTPKENAQQTTLLLLKELGINPKDWHKLLDIPTSVLLEMQMTKLPQAAAKLDSIVTRGIGGSNIGGFSPVVDGEFLPNHPFDPTAPDISKDKPLMVGWNEDEYTFFGMTAGDMEAFSLSNAGLKSRLEKEYGNHADLIINTYKKTRPTATPSQIYIAIRSLQFSGLGSVEIAEKKVEQNAAPVYLYNFGYKSEMKIPGTDYPMGTPHAMDIQFKFYNSIPDENGVAPEGMGGTREERFEASQNFSELWTTFARTGKPAAKDQPEWVAYNLEDRPTMKIDTNCEIIKNRHQEEIDMWKNL